MAWKQEKNRYPIPESCDYPTAFEFDNFYTEWVLQREEMTGYPHPAEVPRKFEWQKVYHEWRITNEYGEYPHIITDSEMPFYGETVEPFHFVTPISIYDKCETSFEKNGLRFLTPSVAEAKDVDGEAPTLHIEHPIDDSGAWKLLQLDMILYAPIPYRGKEKMQPFRIYKISKKRQGYPVIVCEARHIFYDLNCAALNDVRPTEKNGQDAIRCIFDGVFNPYGGKQATENFCFSSDIEETSTAYYERKTVTSALIGDENSVASRWGGELYVDSLYFSINKRKEGAKDNAFNIEYGNNLIEIDATYDNTNTFSLFSAQGNNGSEAYGAKSIQNLGFPFEKTLMANFSYSDEEQELQNFSADFSNYFKKINEIEASYSVSVIDLWKLPEYQDFVSLATLETGDTGQINDTVFEISTSQKIIEKNINVLSGLTISLKLGNTVATIAKKRTFSNTITTEQSPERKEQRSTKKLLDDLIVEMLIDAPIRTTSGKLILTESGKYIKFQEV